MIFFTKSQRNRIELVVRPEIPSSDRCGSWGKWMWSLSHRWQAGRDYNQLGSKNAKRIEIRRAPLRNWMVFFLPLDGGCRWTWQSAWSCCLSWKLVWIRHSAKMPSCQWLVFRASCSQKYPLGYLQNRIHEIAIASWLFTAVFSHPWTWSRLLCQALPRPPFLSGLPLRLRRNCFRPWKHLVGAEFAPRIASVGPKTFR